MAADTFKRIFLNENVRTSIAISLKFVPKGPVINIPALVQIMAWRRSGDKPLSEPMLVSLLTHICVTRPQWVKNLILSYVQEPISQMIQEYILCGMNNFLFDKVVMQSCPTFTGARTNGLSRQVDKRDLIGYFESKLRWDYLHEITIMNSNTIGRNGPRFWSSCNIKYSFENHFEMKNSFGRFIHSGCKTLFNALLWVIIGGWGVKVPPLTPLQIATKSSLLFNGIMQDILGHILVPTFIQMYIYSIRWFKCSQVTIDLITQIPNA